MPSTARIGINTGGTSSTRTIGKIIMDVGRSAAAKPFHDVNFAVARPVLTISPPGGPVIDGAATARNIYPRLKCGGVRDLESCCRSTVIGVRGYQCAVG